MKRPFKRNVQPPEDVNIVGERILVSARPVPVDGPFRRGLFVILVAIGVLAAASVFYAQKSVARAEIAIKARDAAVAETKAVRADLQQSLMISNRLLADQKANQEQSVRQREALNQRITSLERFLAEILAASEDASIAAAARNVPLTSPRVTADEQPTAPARQPPKAAPKPPAEPAVEMKKNGKKAVKRQKPR